MRRAWSEARSYGEDVENSLEPVLLAAGWNVINGRALLDRDKIRRAPVLQRPDGTNLTLPDFLCFQDGLAFCVDSKGKDKPSWRRKPTSRARPRWEHGIDLAHAKDYREFARLTDLTVWIAVYETETPIDPENESPLKPSGVWLYLPLYRVFAEGEERPTWPGGDFDESNRGARGEGGILWARSIMWTELPRVTP